jgi:hypothetical protein
MVHSFTVIHRGGVGYANIVARGVLMGEKAAI